jgi:plastocyanin
MKTRTPLNRRRLAIASGGGILALAVVLNVGCPQNDPPPPQAGVTDVDIVNIAFDPMTVTIDQGDSVRWTNRDLVPHTATSGNPEDADAGAIFDSGNLLQGQSFTRQFDDAGEFIYYCRVHPLMMRDAKVIVRAAP